MAKIRKLMVVCAMALMLVVALPSALAQQPIDWCYYGCDVAYWTVPATTDPTPTEPQDEERFIIVAEDDGCWLVWDRVEDVLFPVGDCVD